ncbi:MAG: P-loop NTPase [Pirellulales bacterium]
MHDQADELRQLVLQAARRGTLPLAPAPKLLVVAGGKGGVGTTTVAVQIGLSLARLGCRPVLVDADLRGGDMAALCGLDAHESVADVLAGRLTVHEVMQRGPAGVQVVPGAWGRDSERLASPAAQRRLMAELQDLGRYAEVVIVDAGNGIGEVSHRFWQEAQLVLLVTTPDANAIMDAYACVKVLGERATARVFTLVNAAGSPDEAQQVHLRLEQACRRFLGREVSALGAVPRDPALVRTVQAPATQEAGMASGAFDRVVEALLPLLQGEGHGLGSTATASAA